MRHATSVRLPSSALQALLALVVLASVADGFLPLIHLPGARVLTRPACRSGARCVGTPQLGASRAPQQGAAVGMRASSSELSKDGQQGAWDSLSQDTQQVLQKLGINALSPVQAASIPPIADGRDVSMAAGLGFRIWGTATCVGALSDFEPAPTTWLKPLQSVHPILLGAFDLGVQFVESTSRHAQSQWMVKLHRLPANARQPATHRDISPIIVHDIARCGRELRKSNAGLLPTGGGAVSDRDGQDAGLPPSACRAHAGEGHAGTAGFISHNVSMKWF